MSDFGADIFDQEPPSPKPPPADGKRPARRKARPAAEAAAGTPTPAAGTETGAAPPRRPARRRKQAETEADDQGAPAPKTRRKRRKAGAEEPPVAPPVAPPLVDREPEPVVARVETAAPLTGPTAAAETEPSLWRWTQHHRRGHGEGAVARHTRVAVLLDLHHLQEAARSRGGELSFRKLLRHLAGERRVLRAVCYLLQDAPKPAAGAIAASGFEVRVLDNPTAMREPMQADAAALPSGVETVVLAPGTDDQIALAQKLKAQGLAVETANFEPAGSMDFPHRQLGRECVFVP